MINTINDFIKLKKELIIEKSIINRIKQQKKAKKIINLQNKNETIYFNKIDKVYKLENLHKKINWYKYYLELYLYELIEKYENIQNNKINLK